MSLINESSISSIYLMLGGACNFKCRHCIQEDSGIKCFNPKQNINSNVVKYIWHLINIRPDCYNKIKLLFWGGEPLIYFSVIKDIVQEFQGNLEYVIITNGELLTQEMVDFINANEIYLTLSNDGKMTSNIRTKNMLEDSSFLELFSQVKHKGIDAVIHAYNSDYQGLYSYINSKVKDVHLFTEQLVVSWDMPKDIYDYDLEHYKDSLYKLADKAYQDIITGEETFAVRTFLGTLKLIAYGRKSKRLLPNCMSIYKSMNIDLEGDVYACHNTNIKIGNVTDDRLQLIQAFDEWVVKTWNRKCLECVYFDLCRGGCPLDKVNKSGEKLSCKRLQIFYECCIRLAGRLNHYFEDVDLEVDK